MSHHGLAAARRPLLTRVLAAFLASCCALLVAAGAANAANFFSPTSFWNTPLAGDAPLNSNSSGLVNELVRQKNQYGPWINTNQFSTPIYTVPATQPTVPVLVDSGHPMYTNGLDAWRLGAYQLNAVPIPPNAVPAAGTDHHMVIWQPSTDTMWELWAACNPAIMQCTYNPGTVPGWHAAWGAKITNASSSDGRVPYPYGATASGLPVAGGLMTIAEVQAGSINHALALALPDTQATSYVWPASRTDGNYTGSNAIPEGTRFRLDPRLDIASLNLPRMTRMMAYAAQRYGIVVRDRAGSVAFYGEDPTPTGTNPWNGLYGGRYPSQLLASFPWSSLQALK